MIATINRTAICFLTLGLTACSDDPTNIGNDSGTSSALLADASATNAGVETGNSTPDDGENNDIDNSDAVDITTGNSTDDDPNEDTMGTPPQTDSVVSIDSQSITVNNISAIGMINIQIGGDTRGSLSASFVQLSSNAGALVLSEIDNLTQQGCTAEDNTDINLGSASVPDFQDFDLQLISAGESIIFTGPNGTYVELSSQSVGGITYYTLDEDISQFGPIPTQLTVDIPGDVFPGFSSVSIPNTEPLTELIYSISEATSTESGLTWNAGSNPDAVVSFSTSFTDSQTGETINVNCTTEDDGVFSLPSDIQSRIGSDLQEITHISRRAMRIIERDNAALFVIRHYYR